MSKPDKISKTILLFLCGALLFSACLKKQAQTHQGGIVMPSGSGDSEEAVAPPLRITPLKTVYESYFLIGNVAPRQYLSEDETYILTAHHNAATAENAMKPQPLQPNKGDFRFEQADAIVDAVLAAGMKMHGHTLAWHQQSPAWMNEEGVSREEAIENLTTHARTVAEHFRGRVISWDVLNEAINDNSANPADWRASLRQSRWYQTIGPDYVEIVFRAAREADPGAMLYYNDYNLDNRNKALSVYNMVKELNEKYPNAGGRPLIDGIGMQGHYNLQTNLSNVEASIERFSSLGVEVSVTELDVQAGTDYELTEAQGISQGIVYARLFNVFKKHAETIARVTMWGLNDDSSWRSERSPAMFDAEFQPKPAFFGALNPDVFIAQNLKSGAKSAAKQAEAHYGTPKLDGNDAIWNSATEIPVNQHLTAWQGATGTARVLWDDKNLYVLVTVHNAVMNKTNANPAEQDSVEVFIDENNGKTNAFEKDDGQYRVNFDNEASFNPASAKSGFKSAAIVSGAAYTVAMRIPLRTIKPANGTLVGFDVQINGASPQGMRQSVAMWNDLTGGSATDTSGYGMLKLVK
ncbi:MAG: endo-1,4-beta-xylanase [Treponema sp.]|jgi:endo-1,4-beta-xylanase|nr:endo-1,4-beta-xylanase [Treponema sp.]